MRGLLPEREPIRIGWAEKPTTRNGDKHMKTTDKYVGLDVHKDTIMIAVAESEREGEVRVYGSISSDLNALDGARQRADGGARSEA